MVITTNNISYNQVNQFEDTDLPASLIYTEQTMTFKMNHAWVMSIHVQSLFRDVAHYTDTQPYGPNTHYPLEINLVFANNLLKSNNYAHFYNLTTRTVTVYCFI